MLDLEQDNRVLIFNHALSKDTQVEIHNLAKNHAQNLFKEDRANFDLINQTIQEYLYLDESEAYLYKLAFYLNTFKKETLLLIKTQETNPYCLQANSRHTDFDYLTKATLFTEIIPNVTLNHPAQNYIEAFIIDLMSEQTIFNCEFDTRYQSALNQIEENFSVYLDEINEHRPVFSERFQLDLFLDDKNNEKQEVKARQKMKV